MRPPEHDYVVVRAHPDLPAGFLPEDLDGRWLDLSALPLPPPPQGEPDPWADVPPGVAVPTGRFEVREDGAVTEVWEARP